MVEMRWLITNYEKPKLQYRQKVDRTVRAQVGTGWMESGQTVNLQWTDWIDVPNVEAEEIINHANS